MNQVVPGAGRLRQHLPSVLNSFFLARAVQINQLGLLPQVRFPKYGKYENMEGVPPTYVSFFLQALQHVSNLEEKGLLSKEDANKIMVTVNNLN